jgi:hypothetical protein
MTTPNLENTSNSDAPIAKVNTGISEVTSGLVILAGILDSRFGQDWGLGRNAQSLGPLVVLVVTFGLTIARAIKHHGVVHANAAVYVAQLQAAVSAATTPGVSINSVTAAVASLNSSVESDADVAPAVTEPLDLSDVPTDLPDATK